MIYRRFDSLGREIKGYNYLTVRFLRLFSMPIATKLSAISYSPERIAVISLLLGLIVAFLFTFGQRYLTLLAGITLFLSWILDCVDGDLARLQNKVTYSGAWIDSVAGKLMDIIVVPSICFGLYRHHQSIYIWLLGFVIVGGIHFTAMLSTKVKVMKFEKGIFPKTADAPLEIKRSLLRTVLHEATVGSNIVFYTIIFGAVVNKMFWVLLFSAIYMCCYAIFIAYITRKTTIGLDEMK